MLYRPRSTSLLLRLNLWIFLRLNEMKTRKIARLHAMSLLAEDPTIRQTLSKYGYGVLARQ